MAFPRHLRDQCHFRHHPRSMTRRGGHVAARVPMLRLLGRNLDHEREREKKAWILMTQVSPKELWKNLSYESNFGQDDVARLWMSMFMSRTYFNDLLNPSSPRERVRCPVDISISSPCRRTEETRLMGKNQACGVSRAFASCF